jgi:hypothetical protein
MSFRFLWSLPLAALAALPAQAAFLHYSFSISGGSGSGTFSVDNAGLTGVGTEQTSNSLSISFTPTIPGVTGTLPFTQLNDDFAGAIVEFNNGQLVGLNYLVNLAPTSGGFAFADAIDFLDSTSVTIGSSGGSAFGFFTGQSFGTGVVIYTPVTGSEPIPEPATLLGLACAGLWGFRSRTKRA